MTTSNQEWMSRLSAVECRDSTYQPKNYPLVFKNAKASLIWDAEGKEYVDLCAGFGALPLGHNSKALLETMADISGSNDTPFIEHGMGDVYPSTQKILFLETIKKNLPVRFTKGTLALSGGQAVEIALKTAMLATKNFGFIVFDEGYHGLDLGILPLTSRKDFRQPFEQWISEERVVRLPLNCDEDLLEKAASHLNQLKVGLAAVVVEPVQGRAGIVESKTSWLKKVSEWTHSKNALLVLDEIFTGFGRTGKLTVSNEIDADILCFGKAIGGGFPISACFGTEKAMQAWPESSGEALHTGTFFGHPFSASVGRKTIELIVELKLVERSEVLGQKALQFLKTRLEKNKAVKNVKGFGLMIGIEFVEAGFAAKLMDELRQVGVIALPSGPTGSVLSLTPALNIDEVLFMDSLNKICDFIN